MQNDYKFACIICSKKNLLVINPFIEISITEHIVSFITINI